MRRAALAGLVAALAAAGCTGGEAPAPGPPAPPVSAAGLTWRALAPAPSERTEVAAAVSGTKVYVVGGFRADGGTVSTVEILDTATGAWTRGPDLPLAVNHAMAATVAGRVYVFGGYVEGQKASPAAYRLEGSAWRAVAPMPTGRAAGTAVAVGNSVYVAGGINPGGLARQMLVYDTAADTWSTAPGPPTAREHLGGAGFGGLVYTVGGRTGGTNLDAFEVYDPRTGTWSPLPALPTRRGGLAAAATCSGQLVAVGGEAKATFAEAEVFDVRTGKWGALPPLPPPRHGLGVVALGTTLYALAGGPKPAMYVSAAAEAIDLAPLGPCR